MGMLFSLHSVSVTSLSHQTWPGKKSYLCMRVQYAPLLQVAKFMSKLCILYARFYGSYSNNSSLLHDANVTCSFVLQIVLQLLSEDTLVVSCLNPLGLIGLPSQYLSLIFRFSLACCLFFLLDFSINFLFRLYYTLTINKNIFIHVWCEMFNFITELFRQPVHLATVDVKKCSWLFYDSHKENVSIVLVQYQCSEHLTVTVRW